MFEYWFSNIKMGRIGLYYCALGDI